MKIKKLSTNGNGIADFNHVQYYFPYTAPEDEIELLSISTNKQPNSNEYKVLAKSPHRAEPPCPYYQKCGGCNLQHLDKNTYISFKKDLGLRAIEHINYKVENISLINTELYSRRRTILKATILNNEIIIGFFASKSNNIINIDNCIILEKEMNAIIPDLKKTLLAFNKIHFSQTYVEISITNSNNGLDIVFKSKYEISSKERNAITNLPSNVIRATWKKDNLIQNIFTREIPYVSFNHNQVFLPLESFLQPTLAGQEAIIAFILKHTTTSKKIIDLFAGIGTYSIPLANKEDCNVFAVEGNPNIQNTTKNIKNITYEIRDLYKKPIKKERLSSFDLAIINPPRNGATPQIKSLTSSSINNIILVSCNHETFKRDSKLLINSGFLMEDFILVDQFLFTTHIELVAYFKR